MAGKRKLESESPSKSKGRVKWWRERLRQMERIANATPRPIHCLRWHVWWWWGSCWWSWVTLRYTPEKIWNKYVVTMTYQGDTKARPVPAFSWKCVFIYLRLNLHLLEDLHLPLNSCTKINHLKVTNKIVFCYCIFFAIKAQPVGRSWEVVFEQDQVGLLSIAPTTSHHCGY